MLGHAQGLESMCFAATAENAQAFAQDVLARFPNEVESAKVVRTERPSGWLPNTDVEVLVIAAIDPEELRPKVADLVSEYMWRDDVWVEVRIVEGSPSDEPVKREGVVHA